MSWAWEPVRRAAPQKVHGARPSFVQIILPQERQFGAAERRGCWEPMQEHRRSLGSGGGIVGFVDSSRARIAESRSVIVVDAPCIAVPPGTETFVVLILLAEDVPRDWEGDTFRDLAGDIEARTLCNAGSRSIGVCFAAGVVDREN